MSLHAVGAVISRHSLTILAPLSTSLGDSQLGSANCQCCCLLLVFPFAFWQSFVLVPSALYLSPSYWVAVHLLFWSGLHTAAAVFGLLRVRLVKFVDFSIVLPLLVRWHFSVESVTTLGDLSSISKFIFSDWLKRVKTIKCWDSVTFVRGSVFEWVWPASNCRFVVFLDWLSVLTLQLTVSAVLISGALGQVALSGLSVNSSRWGIATIWIFTLNMLVSGRWMPWFRFAISESGFINIFFDFQF